MALSLCFSDGRLAIIKSIKEDFLGGEISKKEYINNCSSFLANDWSHNMEFSVDEIIQELNDILISNIRFNVRLGVVYINSLYFSYLNFLHLYNIVVDGVSLNIFTKQPSDFELIGSEKRYSIMRDRFLKCLDEYAKNMEESVLDKIHEVFLETFKNK